MKEHMTVPLLPIRKIAGEMCGPGPFDVEYWPIDKVIVLLMWRVPQITKMSDLRTVICQNLNYSHISRVCGLNGN